jgi:hypothetical protein
MEMGEEKEHKVYLFQQLDAISSNGGELIHYKKLREEEKEFPSHQGLVDLCHIDDGQEIVDWKRQQKYPLLERTETANVRKNVIKVFNGHFSRIIYRFSAQERVVMMWKHG